MCKFNSTSPCRSILSLVTEMAGGQDRGEQVTPNFLAMLLDIREMTDPESNKNCPTCPSRVARIITEWL